MTTFDASHQQVRELSPDAHARVLGATGSGKTLLISDLMREWLETQTVDTHGRLILVQNRLHAAKLRDRIESSMTTPVTGTYVRTASSLAMLLCNEYRSTLGEEPLQLMTGTRQDEVLREALESLADHGHSGLDPEMFATTTFRTELRDLWRVLDDFSMTSEQLRTFSVQIEETRDLPEQILRLGERWEFASLVLDRAREIAAVRYPTERTANGILAEATRLLTVVTDYSWHESIPQLVFVDDAADLGEGSLALCAALANRGTKFWMFGDPDISTAAFQGQPANVLTGVHDELARRGAGTPALIQPEQVVRLTMVHRHGTEIRSLITSLSHRVGTAGGWEHRSAEADSSRTSTVQFTTTHTFSEQVGVIAHRLRHRHLGLHDEQAPVHWNDMAVICRSAEEVQQFVSALEDMSIPTQTTSGGIVLSQHSLVRDLLRVLQDALDIEPLTGADVTRLLLGHLGGLDPLSLRRLDHAVMLNERKRALAEERMPHSLAEAYLEVTESREQVPDMTEGRALARVSRVLHAARHMHAEQGTPREVLWAAWHASGLSETLSNRALGATGTLASVAHRALDAVIELFFVFERHEEQVSDVSIRDLIDEVLSSEVPQDSLAAQSRREAVVVTTPQGASFDEFEVVCIAGPQEGVWPNMRSRGTLMGAHSLQTLLRGETPSAFDRTQTLHEELRLFIQACSRATSELLVVAREDEAEFPSSFFHLGSPFLTHDLPNTTLTLRGYTAAMRRRVLHDPDDKEASSTLAYLAESGVEGASPDSWYGILPPSSTEPLVRVDDINDTVTVSPSHINTVETCPLNWFVSTYAAEPKQAHAGLGTLIHYALEHATSETLSELRSIVEEGWHQLEFESPWLEARARTDAIEMTAGLAEYLRDTHEMGRALHAREATFKVNVQNARVRGIADRVEIREDENGRLHPFIVDLKTGRSHLSVKDAAQDPQLLSYQLGLLEGEFTVSADEGEEPEPIQTFGMTAGAALLYVHPRATTASQGYRLVEQPALDEEMREEFIHRIAEAARVMSQGEFEARVEHHCSDPRQFGKCAIHIIPAVSYE